MQIQLDKYHGCGNDFILLDYAPTQDWPKEMREDFIRRVCDRHTGIGADGCIFVKEDPLEMIYYNQDGSRADMCGNGIRCFANYCHDHGITNSKNYTVFTLAGDQIITELSEDPFVVQVIMGKPDFSAEKIQLDLKQLQKLKETSGTYDTQKDCWELPVMIQDETILLHSMYMGTIHTVVFVEDAFDPALEQLGKAICGHPLFSRQTNVNFIEVLDDKTIRASTYERGCGMTLACGTGMCSAGVACLHQKKSGPDLHVIMKQGYVDIHIEPDGTVCLTGPATHIMKGTYEYEYNPSTQTA